MIETIGGAGGQHAASRVLLGLGATVDVEIEWDDDAVGAVARELGVTTSDLDATASIADERSLMIALLSAVRSGRGDERFADSSDIVRRFAARFASHVTIGGTAVRAALILSLLGTPSTVHTVHVDATVRRLLPTGTVVLHSGEVDSLDPHLIIQFPRGARIRLGDGVVIAPGANRFIVANDPPNRELALADELPAAIGDADVAVLSTLNAIQDEQTMNDRLSELSRMLDAADETVIFWEDAAYHAPSLRQTAAVRMARIADVYSMNEDELASFIGREVDLLDAADVAASVRELSSSLPARIIVIHTRYWALAYGADAEQYRVALRGGIDAASSRYVHGDRLTEHDYTAIRSSDTRDDVLTLTRNVQEVEPLIVCEPGYELHPERPTTIGLGDAFVGGFVAALVRHGKQKSSVGQTDQLAAS